MASSPVTSENADRAPSLPDVARGWIATAFLLISALYFVDTILRATLKTFWYDELFTVYLCRLPTFHVTWAAVLGRTDLNPPLFYLLTRWAQHFSGEGLIATRLPAMIGFWIFGICLYSVVGRRLGRICGCIAALAPWFTYTGYYAYEARPYGVMLAWSGLMLLCWQRSREAHIQLWLRNLWLAGLSLSYLGGLLTHFYAIFFAVPFLLVEVDSLLRRRRIHLWTCIAILLPPCLVVRLYLQLTHSYTAGVTSGGLHVHPYEVLQHFIITVFGPGLILVIILLALIAWRTAQNSPPETRASSLTREELIVALGFLLFPVLGVIAAKLTHGPYFDRYFLAVTTGYAMLLAQLVAVLGTRRFVARFLLAAMLFFLASDTLIAAYCHWHHADLDQVGPGNLVVFGPDPAKPFTRNSTLLQDTSGLDILVTAHPDYLFFQYYASPELRRRLIYATPDPNEEFLASYRRLSRWTGIGLRTTIFEDYFATHRDFLVYEVNRDDCPDCMQKILSAGYNLRSIERDTDGKLERFSK